MNLLDLIALTPMDTRNGIGRRPIILAGMLACCEQAPTAFKLALLGAVE